MAQTRSLESSAKSAPPIGPEFFNGLEPLAAAKSMLEPPLRASSALLNFAGERMRAHAEFYGHAAQCRSFEDATHLQAEFLQAMSNDYAREMKILAEIAFAAPSPAASTKSLEPSHKSSAVA
jgi:hypothetical protein